MKSLKFIPRRTSIWIVAFVAIFLYSCGEAVDEASEDPSFLDAFYEATGWSPNGPSQITVTLYNNFSRNEDITLKTVKIAVLETSGEVRWEGDLFTKEIFLPRDESKYPNFTRPNATIRCDPKDKPINLRIRAWDTNGKLVLYQHRVNKKGHFPALRCYKEGSQYATVLGIERPPVPPFDEPPSSP